MVMKSTEFATIIGTAWLAILIMTVVAKKLHSTWTAEGRAQALHNLFLEVDTRHRYLVKRLLPMLDARHHEQAAVEALETITKLLIVYDHPLTFLLPAPILTPRSEGSRKDSIMREVSRSGVYRWSPLYKREEMENMMYSLTEIDLETWVSLFSVTTAGE